jgi:hypothetical protein
MARETKYRSTSSFYLPSIEGGGKQHVLFAIRTANVWHWYVHQHGTSCSEGTANSVQVSQLGLSEINFVQMNVWNMVFRHLWTSEIDSSRPFLSRLESFLYLDIWWIGGITFEIGLFIKFRSDPRTRIRSRNVLYRQIALTVVVCWNVWYRIAWLCVFP